MKVGLVFSWGEAHSFLAKMTGQGKNLARPADLRDTGAEGISPCGYIW